MGQYACTAWLITDDAGLAAYMDCACWSSYDDEHGELQAHQLSAHAKKLMADDWDDFLTANRDDIGDRITDAAHDFWLTRNGHGAGFWDTSRWDKEAGKRLTKSAEKYKCVYLYIGDDGAIYHS